MKENKLSFITTTDGSEFQDLLNRTVAHYQKMGYEVKTVAHASGIGLYGALQYSAIITFEK